MNKKGQATILLLILIVGIIAAFAFGWVSFGKKDITPTESDLPQEQEEQPDETDTNKFQECNLATDCNWDHTLYYNRDCEGEWRCLESPYPDKKLCSYGCPGNEFCGDGICGGNFENEWNCPDCSPTQSFIGELEF